MGSNEKKAVRLHALKEWESAYKDCKEARFIQLGNSLLLSPQFQALNTSTQIVYIDMMMESGGNQRFKFPQATMKKYNIAPRTGRRAIAELIENSFIKCIQNNKNLRKANEYLFIYKWKKM